jgi:hypothetical protein
MRRKLVIEENHGIVTITTASFSVSSKTLDGALARARVRARVPEDVEIHSQYEACEILDSLMGRREGS